MIRLAAGGYCGSAFSSRSGRSGYCASSASVSSWRSMVVALADRPRLVRPVRVDLGHRAQQLGATSRTARSGTTGGSTARGRSRYWKPCGHLVAVVRHREHPVRRALEDLQVLDLLGDDRGELGGAAAGADDADPLAGEVDGVVPAGGVERRPGERCRGPRSSGSCGRFSWPTALITALAVIVRLLAVGVDGAHRPRRRARRRTRRTTPRC